MCCAETCLNVKPLRKAKAAKNNRNDAEAVATAARQGNMRLVPVKGVDQPARLSWHRTRDGRKQAIGNRIRGLLAEFGVVMAQGDATLKRQLAIWMRWLSRMTSKP